jgi:hypothetical protein
MLNVYVGAPVCVVKWLSGRPSATAQIRSSSSSGTPWPVTSRKPDSRSASSTRAATAVRPWVEPSNQGRRSTSGTVMDAFSQLRRIHAIV